MHKYKLKYMIEPGTFLKPKLRDVNYGLTDEVLMCSYIEQEDGGGSYAWVSCNGIPGSEMAWERKVHCLLTLVKQLSEDAPEDCPNQKELLIQFFEIYRNAIIKSNENE